MYAPLIALDVFQKPGRLGDHEGLDMFVSIGKQKSLEYYDRATACRGVEGGKMKQLLGHIDIFESAKGLLYSCKSEGTGLADIDQTNQLALGFFVRECYEPHGSSETVSETV
ncbi:hypothetical protein PAAG_01334 [Paracoccidioides lutzii Pb01]|uniref:Uncharacterized protein n=1 Tax=Paracoccidioides lutzii (strain ATCC MYA-826 / Pb01) TaxID=502779 RepID=C1GS39_PARBA|nr:hypothetical protein PAAG_01334 [Paracoccidioides lutzii Pb01]EEH38872.2 hypothetical protein PAAG_01334 [Paracoccidioides lutzii Pb01]